MSQPEQNQESHGSSKPDEKKVTIIINGTLFKEIKNEVMTYEEIVTLAFPDFPQHPERNYSVRYVRGHGDKPEGILSPEGKVKIKDGMEFTVTPTGQS